MLPVAGSGHEIGAYLSKDRAVRVLGSLPIRLQCPGSCILISLRPCLISPSHDRGGWPSWRSAVQLREAMLHIIVR